MLIYFSFISFLLRMQFFCASSVVWIEKRGPMKGEGDRQREACALMGCFSSPFERAMLD